MIQKHAAPLAASHGVTPNELGTLSFAYTRDVIPAVATPEVIAHVDARVNAIPMERAFGNIANLPGARPHGGGLSMLAQLPLGTIAGAGHIIFQANQAQGSITALIRGVDGLELARDFASRDIGTIVRDGALLLDPALEGFRALSNPKELAVRRASLDPAKALEYARKSLAQFPAGHHVWQRDGYLPAGIDWVTKNLLSKRPTAAQRQQLAAELYGAKPRAQLAPAPSATALERPLVRHDYPDCSHFDLFVDAAARGERVLADLPQSPDAAVYDFIGVGVDGSHIETLKALTHNLGRPVHALVLEESVAYLTGNEHGYRDVRLFGWDLGWGAYPMRCQDALLAERAIADIEEVAGGPARYRVTTDRGEVLWANELRGHRYSKDPDFWGSDSVGIRKLNALTGTT